jgi:hypothetical protein
MAFKSRLFIPQTFGFACQAARTSRSCIFNWELQQLAKELLYLSALRQYSMDLRAEKYDIIERVMLLEDEETLLQIKQLLEPQEELSEEMKQLLYERLKQHETDPSSGEDWKVVRERLTKKYGVEANHQA